VTSFISAVQFDKNGEGYMKHTADSNSIERAVQELEKAIDYIEPSNLTSGYTSIV
jgi:hypothetical protein